MTLVDHELVTLPEHLSLTPIYSGVRVAQCLALSLALQITVCPFVLFILAIVFCSVYFGHCILFCLFWPLYFRSLLLLITPSVSSNFS